MTEEISWAQAWACLACRDPGPVLMGPCKKCGSELPSPLSVVRRAGAASYNAALAASEAGRWREAIAAVRRALSLLGPSGDLLALQGLLCWEAGRLSEAIHAWEAAGPEGPHRAWLASVLEDRESMGGLTAYNEALGLAQEGAWEAAAAKLAPAAAEGSRLAESFLLQGLAFWELGQRDRARAAWQRVLLLDPSTPGLDRFLALPSEPVALPARTGKRRIAAALAVALLSTAVAISQVYRASEWAGRAATQDQLAGEREVGRQKAQAQADAARAEIGKLTETLAATRTASASANSASQELNDLRAALGPVSGAAAELRYQEGYRLFAVEEYPEAVRAFDAALTLDKTGYFADDAIYLSGKAAELSGDAAAALRSYERLTQEQPDSPYVDDALFFAGRMAEKTGQPKVAVGFYERLLAAFPTTDYAADATSAVARLVP